MLNRHELDKVHVDVFGYAMEGQVLAWRTRANIAFQALHGGQTLLAYVHQIGAIVS